MIYLIYAICTISAILIIKWNKNTTKSLVLIVLKAKNTLKNPKVVRDVTLAIMVNGIFSMLNATCVLSFIGFTMLTMISFVGIVISNDKIN